MPHVTSGRGRGAASASSMGWDDSDDSLEEQQVCEYSLAWDSTTVHLGFAIVKGPLVQHHSQVLTLSCAWQDGTHTAVQSGMFEQYLEACHDLASQDKHDRWGCSTPSACGYGDRSRARV